MNKQVELNSDEIDMIQDFCKMQIKKAQKMRARVDSKEFLTASGGKAKSMLNAGLVDHLYAQTAVELLKKLGVEA